MYRPPCLAMATLLFEHFQFSPSDFCPEVRQCIFRTSLCIISYLFFQARSFFCSIFLKGDPLSQHACGGQWMTCGSCFSPSTAWDPGIKLSLSALAASISTHGTMLPSLSSFLNMCVKEKNTWSL